MTEIVAEGTKTLTVFIQCREVTIDAMRCNVTYEVGRKPSDKCTGSSLESPNELTIAEREE